MSLRRKRIKLLKWRKKNHLNIITGGHISDWWGESIYNVQFVGVSSGITMEKWQKGIEEYYQRVENESKKTD